MVVVAGGGGVFGDVRVAVVVGADDALVVGGNVAVVVVVVGDGVGRCWKWRTQSLKFVFMIFVNICSTFWWTQFFFVIHL